MVLKRTQWLRPLLFVLIMMMLSGNPAIAARSSEIAGSEADNPAQSGAIPYDFNLPVGASLIPPSEWPDSPPNNQVNRYDGWGRINKIWICVQFDQLPAGNDIICGYADVFPLSPPPSLFGEQIWGCIEATNVLIYSVPFNKGSCYVGWGSLVDIAFEPTEQQINCGTEQRNAAINQFGGLPPDTSINYERNRSVQDFAASRQFLMNIANELTLALIDRFDDTDGRVFASASRVMGQLSTAQQYMELANAFQPAGDQPSCADEARQVANASELTAPMSDQYQIVPSPLPFTPTVFTADDEMTQREANAINDLLQSQAEAVGYARALQIAVERADLAARAGDDEWETRQVDAANLFAWNIGLLLEEQIELYAELAAAFQDAGHVSTESVTTEALTAVHYSLHTPETQAKLHEFMTSMGATEAEKDLLIHTLLLTDPAEAAKLGGGKFPDALIDPIFVEALETAAATYQKGIDGTYVGNRESKMFVPLVMH